MNSNKGKPEKQEQLQNNPDQKQADLRPKPVKKKNRLKFKKEDMIQITYNF